MNRPVDMRQEQGGGFTCRSPFFALRFSNRGFTLVEAVISASILSVTMLVATLAFTTIVQLQQKAATVRQVQQNTRYVLETISRDVRNSTHFTLVSTSEVRLPNSLDPKEQIIYGLDSGQVYRLRCSEDDCVGADITDGDNLTQGQIRVTGFRLAASSAPPGGHTRPLRIHITAQQATSGLDEEDPYFYEYETTALVVPRR